MLARFALLVGYLSSALNAQGAEAPPPGSVHFSAPSYSGSGCPAGSAALNVSPDQQAFTLLFDSFVAEGDANSGAEHGKSCLIDLTIDVPTGWSFSVVTVDTRGFAALQTRHVSVDIRSRISIGNNNGVAAQGRLRLRGPYNDDFQLRAAVNGNAGRWSSCTLQHHPVRIDTELKLKREALAAVDSIDGQVQALELAWRRCR